MYKYVVSLIFFGCLLFFFPFLPFFANANANANTKQTAINFAAGALSRPKGCIFVLHRNLPCQSRNLAISQSHPIPMPQPYLPIHTQRERRLKRITAAETFSCLPSHPAIDTLGPVLLLFTCLIWLLGLSGALFVPGSGTFLTFAYRAAARLDWGLVC